MAREVLAMRRRLVANGNALAPSLETKRQTQGRADSWLAWIFARVSLDEAAALLQ